MNQMLCGYRDDPRQWAEPEPVEEEDDDPRTEPEKRISWLCSDWSDALTDDTYDEWNGVRLAIYGASQMLVHVNGMHRESAMLLDLSRIAFENGLDCIRRGKYEGATP